MNAWYHGTPLSLSHLMAGATITRNRRLAEVFSHKPEIVSVEDDGTIRHNGRAAGLLYVIDENVLPEDTGPHPRTTMPVGWEWLTRRTLRLRLLGPVELTADEMLDDATAAQLRRRAEQRRGLGR